MFSNYSVFNKKERCFFQNGFGLIELLVSIAIMAFVSTIVFVRQTAFDNSILLRNQAFDIALDIRAAQFSAVSVSGQEGEFQNSVGLYFAIGAASDRFIVFRDEDKNGEYDSGTDTVTDIVLLDDRFYFKSIELDGMGATYASVVFARPSFDAIVKNISGVAVPITRIEVASRRDNTKSRIIEITKTGQVSVE